MKDQIINSIKHTLEIEAKAIMDVTNHLSDEMIKAVLLIFNGKGRVVITGVGKSAIIAQKIVATLNSTGTPALFLHAADAIHGDLGLIHEDDVVMCISKSGDTEELKVLLPYIKMRRHQVICLVSNKHSYLAQHADCCIFLPIDQEADPNNLAPTASTTVQLAMGDAIAMALLQLKGFTPEHFALLHPGGSLGKVLYTKVRDISVKNVKPAVGEQDSLDSVILTISSSRLGATAVVDKDGTLCGIITDGDLRRMLQHKGYNNETIAADVMTRQAKTIAGEALAIDALRYMQENAVSQLIVMQGAQYDGIIHLHDLIREGIV